jgi:hypothetical protein
MTPRRGLIISLIAFIILFTASVKGYTKRTKILREHLVGTWIGLTEDELQMIRLILSSDGKGVIGFSFLDERPCVFRVTSWVYDKGTIDIDLEESTARCPIDRGFEGVARGSAIELTVKGQQWKRKASLRREEELIKRLNRIEAEME